MNILRVLLASYEVACGNRAEQTEKRGGIHAVRRCASAVETQVATDYVRVRMTAALVMQLCCACRKRK